MENKFIVLETTDGGGKDTHSKILQQQLKILFNINSTVESEPTKGNIGLIIRQILQRKIECDPYQLQRLFTLDRDLHVETIKELLNISWVICVRYTYSTIAYSKWDKECISDEQIQKLEELNNSFLKPDLVIILDVSPEESMKRVDSRNEEKEIFEELNIQEKVRNEYLKLAEINKDNTVLINANGSIIETFNNIIDAIVKKFNLKQ